MNISPKSVRFDDDTLWVSLSDGRTIVNWNLTPISPNFPPVLSVPEVLASEKELVAGLMEKK